MGNVELLPGLGVYLDAFFDLSSERPAAMEGAHLIPWSAIQYYAEKMAFADDVESLARFHFLLSEMDLFFVNRQNEKLEKERKKAEAKSKRRH